MKDKMCCKTVNICLRARGKGQACLELEEGTSEDSQVLTVKTHSYKNIKGVVSTVSLLAEVAHTSTVNTAFHL